MLGHQACDIGTDAEKGGMSERDDTGIAQNEIKRERKKAHDRNL